MKLFLRFLYESEYIVTDFSIAVPKMFAPKTIYREGFDVSEIHTLLEDPDKTQPIGKRDQHCSIANVAVHNLIEKKNKKTNIMIFIKLTGIYFMYIS